MTKTNLLILLASLICTLTLGSASAQDSQLSSEIQNAIKIRKNNEFRNSQGDNQTNFLIGMCLNIQGSSGCNVSQATKNINGKITSSEAWLSFLESKGIFENYVLGLNGKISDTEGLSIVNLRYRIIDKDNVERDTISGNNCIHTLHFKKISPNSAISKTTRVSDGCSENFKAMMRSDIDKWSDPKKIYPIENRFPEILETRSSTQPQKSDISMSDRLINDLFNYRWVDKSSKCSAINSDYTIYDKQHGRYFVIGGEKQIDAKNLPVVEINEISPNQVNFFIGIGEKARSDNLFNMIVKLQVIRQPDGRTLVREMTANFIDNNWRPLRKDASMKGTPNETTYFPCPSDKPTTTTSQPSGSSDQTLSYPHGKYIGGVMNGKAHGYGTYTSAKSGTIYAGQFIADTFSGDGTMTWTNGNRFVGKWQNDVGVSGRMTYTNGTTQTGTVRNGQFTPSPAQSNPQSQSPSSRSTEDVRINYNNGDFYFGKVKDGKPDGIGSYWSASRSENIQTLWSNGQAVNGSIAFLKYTSKDKANLPQIEGTIVNGKFIPK